MEDKIKKIIARVILSAIIVTCGIALIPEKQENKKDDDIDEKPIEETLEQIEEPIEVEKPIEIKTKYSKEEFIELLALGEAKEISIGIQTLYYVNIHATSNANYTEVPGYSLWQEYLPDKYYNEYQATNNFMYSPINQKELELKK